MSMEPTYVAEETKTQEELDKMIEDLTVKVDSLYLFRDHYFENHPIEKAIDKNDDLKKQLQSTLDAFLPCEDESISNSIRANYLYLKGKALNVLPDYDQNAAQALSRAVKLNPKHVDAWNELGECYWKDCNLTEAKNCFNGAIPHKKNKISLRNMSIVLRQESSPSPAERKKNIEKSLELAKEAVQMDFGDGVSWSILGNAYLCSFFVIGQDPNVLKLSMNSYKQALKDAVAKGQPDLHYNLGMALTYEEDYSEALKSFSRAIALNPTWNDPIDVKDNLISYLDNLSELVKSKGKMKGKKLQQMIQQLDEKLLGPYANGEYKSRSSSLKLESINLDKLKEGINLEKVVLGKVVCSVRNERTVPFTFCMIDKEENCIVVMIYNLADGKGVIIGDSVAIPEPFVTNQDFTHNDKQYQFKSIRVDNPNVMVVNGKKVGKDNVAATMIVNDYKYI